MPDIKEVVKERYGKAALRVVQTQGKACCGPSCCSSVPGAVDPITVNLYDAKQTAGLPAEAVLASLGCGNPTALATSTPATSSSTSARAAASTCCCRPSASARPARRTASI